MMTRMYRAISDTAGLHTLLASLFDRNRKGAAIVITHRRSGGGPCIGPVNIQRIVGSGAQVYLISPGLLAEFNEHLHNVFGIAPSGMRIFKPNMTLQDHHLRHPIWNEVRLDQMVAEMRLIPELLRHTVDIKRFVNGRDTLRPEKVAEPVVERERPTRPILRISLNA